MRNRAGKFFVRLFPVENRDFDCIKIENDNKTISLRNTLDFDSKRKPQTTFWRFSTDGVFGNVCQDVIYQEVCKDAIESAFGGTDCVLLVCGQSGCGKTYSLTGLKGKYEQRGIVPRLLRDVFAARQSRECTLKVSFSMSIVEAADKNLYDLLNEPVSICTDFKKCRLVSLKSETEALKYVFESELRRKCENKSTNCGTSVITIHLKCVSLVKSDPYIYISKIHLIDMAGLDTIWKNHNKSQVCQGFANISKSFLEYFVTTVTAGKAHIKANKRLCALVKHLGQSLSNGQLRVLAHICPTHDDLAISVSTLKFGLHIINSSKVELVCNQRPNPDLKLRSLNDELNELRDQLLVSKLIGGEYSSHIISREQLEHVKRVVSLFLKGEASVKCVLAVVEPSLFLTALQEQYNAELDSMRQKMEISPTRMADSDISEVIPEKSSERYITRRNIVDEDSTMWKKTSKKPDTQIIPAKNQDNESSIETSDQPTRDELWKEFSMKCPELVQKFNYSETAMINSKKEQEDLVAKYIYVLEQIDLTKRDLEEARYQRLSTIGNKVGPSGALYESEEEIVQKNKLRELENQIRDLKDEIECVHAEYVVKQNFYLSVRTETENSFQEYCSTIYSNSLALPEFEEPVRKHFLSSSDSISNRDEMQFKQLQRSLNKTTPFAPKKMWRV